MPHFVVVQWHDKPSVIRTGGGYYIHTEVLAGAFDTLESAERAARKRAQREQEWPWTSVYVVESANQHRAQHCPDPNKYAKARAINEIFLAAQRDPDGRMPELPQRLSAFQPPRAPLGPPVPSALPPAAFSASEVQRAFDALTAAGFMLVQRDHSVYHDDRPHYFPTQAALERSVVEARRLGRPASVSSEQTLLDLRFKSLDDVRGVGQEFELYQGEGEYDIGGLDVLEFRMEVDIDELLGKARQLPPGEVDPIERPRKNYSTHTDMCRLCRFRHGRVLFMLRLWDPDDQQWDAVVAPLQGIVGPAEPLD